MDWSIITGHGEDYFYTFALHVPIVVLMKDVFVVD